MSLRNPRMDLATKELILETPAGFFHRVIQAPAPLRFDLEAGKATEQATLDAAQIWGLPDFAFNPKEEAVGSGTRELGDGTLVVDRDAVVIQCKRRGASPTSNERESAWLEKHIKRGMRQGRGTVRRYQASPKELVNGRGEKHVINGADKDWTVVVVVEHPEIPNSFQVPEGPEDTPCVVLTRQDWEFLFDQLKSTYAVCRYLNRTRGDKRTLGEEPVLYYQLASEDAATTPKPFPAELADLGSTMNEPMLPLEPVADGELAPYVIVRSVLEDVAIMNVEFETGDVGLRVLATLDSLSVESRRLLGNWILARTEEVFKLTDGISWRFRVIIGESDVPHFGFAVCSHAYSDLISEAFGAWLQLRHIEHQDALGISDITSVGVLLTPTLNSGRPFDVTLKAAEGDLELSDERVEAIREVWKSREEAAAPIERS